MFMNTFDVRIVQFRCSLVAQWVKDQALSLQWLWLLHWCEFDKFRMPRVQPKQNKTRSLSLLT